MRGTKGLLILYLAIISTTLFGCGGGGTSKPKPVASVPVHSSVATEPSSVLPASASAISSVATEPSTLIPSSVSSQSSSSSAQSNKLIITGMVVADALAEADIEFMVGTQRFTTKADAQKKYRLELDVLTENLTLPFTAKATGVNNNNWVQFAALFPSVSTLKKLTGEDSTLDANEYFGVNISGLTTAEFVLAKEGKQKIGSDEDRKSALLKVSTERQLEMASILDVFLKNINYDLPKNTATTLDFLLDSNTALADIAVLKQSNPLLITEASDSITADVHQTKPATLPTEGELLIESTNFIFLLNLNKDGTGRLQTGNMPSTQLNTWIATNGVKYVDTPITWIKKDKTIKINLVNPIVYGQVSYFLDPNSFPNNYISCEQQMQPSCDLTLSSILLNFTANNELNKALTVSIGADIKTTSGLIAYNYANQIQYATMWNTIEFHVVTNKDIEGFEWYLDIYKYVFNSNGTASQLNLKSNIEKIIDWKIENNHLVLDAGSTDLWLTYPNESGFFVTQMKRIGNDPNQWDALLRKPMVKRQPVQMSEADWVGRWTSFPNSATGSLYDVYNNRGWRDGFETASAGSWSALSQTTQTALSNGLWRMKRDVLAIYDGRYYIQNCQGFEQPNFVPMYCDQEIVTKDNSFTGKTFWPFWSNPLFQEVGSDAVWDFFGHTLYLSTNENWMKKNYIRVSANKLYDRAGGKMLELISSSIQTIDICEYDIFADCSTGTLYKLERGIEIKISGASEGHVSYLSNGGSTSKGFGKTVMVPRNKPSALQLNPNIGFEINSVSGCGGELAGNNYNIPALTADCELLVNFTPIAN